MENLNDKTVPVRDILPNDAAPVSASPSAAEFEKRAADFLRRKPEIPTTERPPASKRSLPKISLRFPFRTGLIVLGVAILGGFAISVFSKAVVTIVPRSEMAAMEAAIQAGIDTDIPIETAAIEEFAVATGKSSGVEEISERAVGRVFIYNAYSTEPQSLVRRTRLETADGKVFRLAEAVTVPSATVVNGKIEQSFVEVEAIADQPGEAYNIGLQDFTIPGFKGSAKYEKFYAKSKTPMSGGFVGRAGVVSDADVAAMRETLERELNEKLDSKLASRLPSGFFVPEGARRSVIEVEVLRPKAGERADSFEMRLKGVVTALAIRQTDMERALAVHTGKAADEEVPVIQNFEVLKFSAEAVNFEKQIMTIGVQGNAQFVWRIPTDDVKKSLVSASGEAGRAATFEAFPQIRQAAIAYRPAWWKFFPRSEDKIIVEEQLAPFK